MRISSPATLIAAGIGTLLVFLAGALLLSPPVPLIVAAGFDRASISPNADGSHDVAVFSYTLARPAKISLSLTAASGDSYWFRQDQARDGDDYSVQFSGVVDGFLLDNETVPGTVERRLMPNGSYRWRLEALPAAGGDAMTAEGTFTVESGDARLPIMSEFAIAPQVFSPNQDGVADRVSINIYLEKAVERLDVFLVGPAGERIPISARVEERQYGEAGRHRFDYEGGIDLGADPPPDGAYTVVALAQDTVGQRIRQERQLIIETGGKPYAEIKPQAVGVAVAFAAQDYHERYFTTIGSRGELLPQPDDAAALAYSQQITVPRGQLLIFRLTVDNYGEVPIRTSGPPPGTVYQQEQLAGALGAFAESGAWRVGIQCETSKTSFPYRWAVGADADLAAEYDEASGNTYHYLPAGARAVVWGGIRLTEAEARNPQNCWAGLIHEDVAISLRNNHVGMRSIMIADPSAEAANKA